MKNEDDNILYKIEGNKLMVNLGFPLNKPFNKAVVEETNVETEGWISVQVIKGELYIGEKMYSDDCPYHPNILDALLKKKRFIPRKYITTKKSLLFWGIKFRLLGSDAIKGCICGLNRDQSGWYKCLYFQNGKH